MYTPFRPTRSLTRTITLTAALGSVALSGCLLATEDDPSDEDDVAVAESAAESAESSADLFYLAGYLDVAAVAEGEALVSVQTAIEADMQSPACVAFETDGLTYLDVTFDECVGAYGLLYLDGTFRGEVAADLTGLTWTVTTTGFTVNAAAVSGDWEIRHPFDSSQPSTWTGTSTTVGPSRTVTTASSASWNVDAGGSCIDYSIDGELTRPLGTDTLAISDVRRCMGQCPARGDVHVEYALGATVSWTYNGDGTATVTGAGGRVFDVVLPCNF